MDLIPETARQMATAEHRHWVVCFFAGFWTWWKLQVQAVKCAKWCRWWKKCQTTSSYGGFLKWWYPTTMGFPTKNDHFGVFWGYRHLRKHPYGKYPIIYSVINYTSQPVVVRGYCWWFRNPKANHRLICIKFVVKNGISTTVPSTGDPWTWTLPHSTSHSSHRRNGKSPVLKSYRNPIGKDRLFNHPSFRSKLAVKLNFGGPGCFQKPSSFGVHDWSSKGYVYVLDIALVCCVFSEISLWNFEYFGGFPSTDWELKSSLKIPENHGVREED